MKKYYDTNRIFPTFNFFACYLYDWEFFVQYNMHAPTEKEMEATRNIEWQDFEKNPEKYRHEFSVLGVNLEDYVISSPSEMTLINFEDYIIKWVD